MRGGFNPSLERTKIRSLVELYFLLEAPTIPTVMINDEEIQPMPGIVRPC